MAVEPIRQVGHVALPKLPKVGHSPTNPSNMQYELVIIQYDNNHDEINQQAIDILRIVPQWYGVRPSAWQPGTKVLIT